MHASIGNAYDAGGGLLTIVDSLSGRLLWDIPRGGVVGADDDDDNPDDDDHDAVSQEVAALSWDRNPARDEAGLAVATRRGLVEIWRRAVAGGLEWARDEVRRVLDDPVNDGSLIDVAWCPAAPWSHGLDDTGRPLLALATSTGRVKLSFHVRSTGKKKSRGFPSPSGALSALTTTVVLYPLPDGGSVRTTSSSATGTTPPPKPRRLFWNDAGTLLAVAFEDHSCRVWKRDFQRTWVLVREYLDPTTTTGAAA
mmetsp:Transcript_3174/g.12129  ORF Transcript_3174/g.12129 Transcript_3174/m.12129 type:complete len:253 (+) Transcript_3174:938-1696(+)